MVLKSFLYEFEELPLVIASGYGACEVTGFAEIGYDMAGAWSVQRIGFEGFKHLAPTLEQQAEALRSGRPQKLLERRKVWLDVGDPIQMIVYDRLEHDWHARVQDQVDDRILDDRNSDEGSHDTDHQIALKQERA
jgi:hypothetical protein